MKAPTSETYTTGSMKALIDYSTSIELLTDYGLTIEEIAEKDFNIPPIKYLVDEKITYKDNNKCGWFLIEAISVPVRCAFCNDNTNIPNFTLIGFLETTKLLGLTKDIKGCTTCPDCGFYQTYPKELIEWVLKDAQKKIKIFKSESVDEIIKKEKNNCDIA